MNDYSSKQDLKKASKGIEDKIDAAVSDMSQVMQSMMNQIASEFDKAKLERGFGGG